MKCQVHGGHRQQLVCLQREKQAGRPGEPPRIVAVSIHKHAPAGRGPSSALPAAPRRSLATHEHRRAHPTHRRPAAGTAAAAAPPGAAGRWGRAGTHPSRQSAGLHGMGTQQAQHRESQQAQHEKQHSLSRARAAGTLGSTHQAAPGHGPARPPGAAGCGARGAPWPLPAPPAHPPPSQPGAAARLLGGGEGRGANNNTSWGTTDATGRCRWPVLGTEGGRESRC